MFDLTDRVVIVTGAAGNLGPPSPGPFALPVQNWCWWTATRIACRACSPSWPVQPGHYFAAPVDLTDEAAVKAMIDETLNRFGRIDVLVNVAGGYRGGTPVHETPLAIWDFLLNLNARTVYIASSAVIPAMLRQGSGKIVNVAARAALQGSAKLGAYSAAKSAVMRLTEAMAAELKNERHQRQLRHARHHRHP